MDRRENVAVGHRAGDAVEGDTENIAAVLGALGRLADPVRPVVGVATIGLEAYWPQFPGLRQRLLEYTRAVTDQLALVADVVNVGMADTAQAAREAGERLGRARVDLTAVHAATYATSSQVVPLIQRAGAPALILNLQPVDRLDYDQADTAEWLANCSACCVPELAGALARCGITFRVVSGTLRGPHSTAAWADVHRWCRAAGLRRSLRDARVGFLGHTYPGMLDMYSDFTQHHGILGLHVEILEMEDLAAAVDAVAEREAADVLATVRKMFKVDPSVELENLGWAARVAAGMERLVRERALTGLT